MHRVEAAKSSAVQNVDHFLRNFSHVPDEYLHWTPAPAAKSPLRVAAHTALYMARFAKMISDRRLAQPDNLQDWIAQRDAEEAAVVTREEVEAAFRSGTAQVLAALDTLTEKDLESTLDSGMGWTMPMTFLIDLPAWHTTLHLGQIDYLQTCWNDQNIYVG